VLTRLHPHQQLLSALCDVASAPRQSVPVSVLHEGVHAQGQHDGPRENHPQGGASASAAPGRRQQPGRTVSVVGPDDRRHAHTGSDHPGGRHSVVGDQGGGHDPGDHDANDPADVDVTFGPANAAAMSERPSNSLDNQKSAYSLTQTNAIKNNLPFIYLIEHFYTPKSK
jgi:hypothetical protein